jgi:hypothetical protein
VLWCHVVWRQPEVSEEHIASTFSAILWPWRWKWFLWNESLNYMVLQPITNIRNHIDLSHYKSENILMVYSLIITPETMYNVYFSELLPTVMQILPECTNSWKVKERKVNLSMYRMCRPIGLWDVEALTFSGKLAHRWQWGCQSYALVTLYPQKYSRYSFLLEAESTIRP